MHTCSNGVGPWLSQYMYLYKSLRMPYSPVLYVHVCSQLDVKLLPTHSVITLGVHKPFSPQVAFLQRKYFRHSLVMTKTAEPKH